MMFENDVNAERPSASNGGDFENELGVVPSIRDRLRDQLPALLIVLGVFALALGLHGAGVIVVGVAGALVVIGLVLLIVTKMRSRVSR